MNPISTRLVACIALAAISAGCSSSGDDTGESPFREARGSTTSTEVGGEADEPEETEAPTTTTEGRTTTAETTTTTTEAPVSVDLAIEAGFTSVINSIGTRTTTAAAVVTNPNADDAACDVKVTFTLKDASGAAVDTTTENVSWIPRGSHALVAPLLLGFDVPQEPTALEVTTLVDHFADVDTLADCDSFVFENGTLLPIVSTTLQLGDIAPEVVGEVTNDGEQVVQNAFVDCVVRAAGAIVGGASTGILDPIQPGQTIAFTSGWITGLPDAAECRVVVGTTSDAVADTLRIESGFSSSVNSIGTRSTSAGAAIANGDATEAACGVDVTFSLQDGVGAQVDTVTERVGWIPAGSTVIVAPLQIGFDLQQEPTAMTVTTNVEKYAAAKSLQECGGLSVEDGVMLTIVSTSLQRESLFTEVVGEVTNTTDAIVEYASLDCLLRAGGVIVGRASTGIIDPIQPGQTIAFSTSYLTGVSDSADSAECQVLG